MNSENGNVVGFGQALFGVFVSENGGAGGVEMGVIVGVVEVPVGVDDAFHWRAAEAIERVFEPRPCRCNESVHDEFAVGAVEDYHASPGAGEHRDIFTKPLRF